MRLLVGIVFLSVTIVVKSQTSPCEKDTCHIVNSWINFNTDLSVPDSNLLIGFRHYQSCEDANCYVEIMPQCPTKEFELTIYNRWGEVLFETTRRGHYWNAEDAEVGVYIWMLKGIYLDGCAFDYKGHLTWLK